MYHPSILIKFLHIDSDDHAAIQKFHLSEYKYPKCCQQLRLNDIRNITFLPDLQGQIGKISQKNTTANQSTKWSSDITGYVLPLPSDHHTQHQA